MYSLGFGFTNKVFLENKVPQKKKKKGYSLCPSIKFLLKIKSLKKNKKNKKSVLTLSLNKVFLENKVPQKKKKKKKKNVYSLCPSACWLCTQGECWAPLCSGQI